MGTNKFLSDEKKKCRNVLRKGNPSSFRWRNAPPMGARKERASLLRPLGQITKEGIEESEKLFSEGKESLSAEVLTPLLELRRGQPSGIRKMSRKSAPQEEGFVRWIFTEPRRRGIEASSKSSIIFLSS